MKTSEMYKVPGRQVYCETIKGWIVETIRCHVWLRFFKPVLPKIGKEAR